MSLYIKHLLTCHLKRRTTLTNMHVAQPQPQQVLYQSPSYSPYTNITCQIISLSGTHVGVAT